MFICSLVYESIVFQLLCRVIYVNPTSKHIGLSATNEMISQSSDLNSDSSIGLIQQCTVLKADSIFGLLVALDDGKKAYAHVRNHFRINCYFLRTLLLMINILRIVT